MGHVSAGPGPGRRRGVGEAVEHPEGRGDKGQPSVANHPHSAPRGSGETGPDPVGAEALWIIWEAVGVSLPELRPGSRRICRLGPPSWTPPVPRQPGAGFARVGSPQDVLPAPSGVGETEPHPYPRPPHACGAPSLLPQPEGRGPGTLPQAAEVSAWLLPEPRLERSRAPGAKI